MASKKGSTGLEWLLREADKPAAEPARERRAPPPPDPGVPIPPSEDKPEPWQVQPVTEIRAPAPAVLETPPNGTPAPVAPTSVPTSAKKSGRDNRVHPRAPVPCEVRYKKGGEQIVAKGRNLSMGGFFVETTKYLPTGDVFQAQIVFPDEPGGSKRLAVIAEVIWATAGDPTDLAKFPPGMGAKFLDVDDSDKPYLKAKIQSALGS